MPISASIRVATRDDTLDPSADRLKGHRLPAIRCPAPLRLVRLTTRDNAPGGIVNLLRGLSSSPLVCHTRRMSTPSTNHYKHHRFPAEISSHGV